METGNTRIITTYQRNIISLGIPLNHKPQYLSELKALLSQWDKCHYLSETKASLSQWDKCHYLSETNIQ